MQSYSDLFGLPTTVSQCSRTHEGIPFLSCVSQSDDLRPITACEKHDPFYTKSRYYHLLPVNLFACGMFLQVFGKIPHLSRSFVVSVPTCLKRVAGIKFRMSIYVQKSMMLMRQNIKYFVLVLLSMERMSKKNKKKREANHPILFYSCFTQQTNFFGFVATIFRKIEQKVRLITLPLTVSVFQDLLRVSVFLRLL